MVSSSSVRVPALLVGLSTTVVNLLPLEVCFHKYLRLMSVETEVVGVWSEMRG